MSAFASLAVSASTACSSSIAPTGVQVWRSRPAARTDERELEELAKDRRGKRVAPDA